MGKSISSSLLSSLFWRFAERCGAQGIQFIVSVILARLLTPDDFGTVGLITVFVSISLVFATSSFGQALVQKKDADNKDFSSVFFFNIVFSILIYFILFFASPMIARFYNDLRLIPIIRVLSISVIIGGINNVQQAYVQKTMQFKRFFWSTLVGTIMSAIVGVTMAYSGFGLWSIVCQHLTSQFMGMAVLWITVKWRPDFVFSVKSLGGLFSYGWKLLASSLLETVYGNIYSLIIGKYFSKSDLAFYDRGKQFPVLIIQNINSAIDSVLFPVLSKLQDEKDRLKSLLRRSMTTSTFVIFPCMAGLAVIAEPLVKLLLTDKWLPAVPFIRFCCFTYAFWPIHTANLQMIKAVGRSDIFLKLEIIKKITGIITLLITLPFGLYAMMWGRCVTTITSSIINAYPNKRLVNYSYIEQVFDLLPSVIITLIMAFFVYLVSLLGLGNILTIIIQVILGVVIYIGLAFVTKNKVFYMLIEIAKPYIKNWHKQ